MRLNWEGALTASSLLQSLVVLLHILGTEFLVCVLVYLYMFLFSATSLFSPNYHDLPKMLVWNHHTLFLYFIHSFFNKPFSNFYFQAIYKPMLVFLSNLCLAMFLACEFVLILWWAKPVLIFPLCVFFAICIGCFSNAFYWTYTPYPSPFRLSPISLNSSILPFSSGLLFVSSIYFNSLLVLFYSLLFPILSFSLLFSPIPLFLHSMSPLISPYFSSHPFFFLFSYFPFFLCILF